MRWWLWAGLAGCQGLTPLGDGGSPPGTAGDTTDPADGGEDTTEAPPVDDDGVSVTGEVCSNGRDDNDDGLADCEDPTCLAVCDLDGDGGVARPLGGDDCDDGNPRIYAGADEVCDGYDNDCDDAADDDDDDVVGAPLWYADRDADGYGDPATYASACEPVVSGVAPRAGDCNDNNDLISPGIAELECDSLDNDCDGGTPDSEDADGDGHGTCDDCDDGNGTVFPGAPEVCDSVDSNCDGADCNLFSDNFETGALSASWVTFGGAQWGVTSRFHHGGAYAAASGDIGDNQITTLQLTLDTPSGALMTFWHKESTERSYDIVTLIIDGANYGEWSGATMWQQESVTLGAGTHEIKWRYQKDISTSTAEDAVWVDDIVIRP